MKEIHKKEVLIMECLLMWKLDAAALDKCLCLYENYRKLSNIRRSKSQNLNVSRLGLQLSLRNILKPNVKWRMKM